MKIAQYNQMMAYLKRPSRQKFQAGGRVGYGMGDIVKPQISYSKTGQNPIKDTPLTVDSEFLNMLVEIELPILKKLDLLAEYRRNKSRHQVEMEDQEIFVGEEGDRARKIGLGWNEGGEGLSGSVKHNVDTGETEGMLKISKSFEDGGRVGFDEGTKPILPRDKFVELRMKHKNTHTNGEFAELLNKDWRPAQADSFNANSVSKRIKDAKNFFPDNFDYKGSHVERAVTEEKMIELWGEENYQKHKKNFSDKKLKNKYITDKNYKELPIEAKQAKSKRTIELKEKKLAAMDPVEREELLAKEAEEAAARTRKSRGIEIKFNKNPRKFKSMLWGDLVGRTYKNMWDSPFKFSEDSLKLIKSKPELNRGDMEKIVLIDKNGNKFNFDTLESYVKEGKALNSKGQPVSWDEVTKSYKIKEFVNKEGFAQKINKATIPNYDPVKHQKFSGWHIAHNTSFKDGPWETHIAPYKANIQEGQARRIFNNLWSGSDAEFKEGKITKEERFNKRKKAVGDYHKAMEPITEIKYSLGKKEHGAATPIEELFKKAGIKLNGEQIKKAQVFLRSALNKGQDISKFLPLPKITRGGAAALDYSLFNFIFGVPGPTAAVGASAWLSKNRLPAQMVGTQAHAMSFMDEMNQKKAEIDEQKNLEAAHRLKKSQETATAIKPFELEEQEEIVTENKPTYGPYANQIKKLIS